MSTPDDIGHLEPDEVLTIADLLAVRGERLATNTGGVGLDLPAIPQDHVGLRALLIAMDEARQAFDRRLSALVTGAAEQATLQVFHTGAADGPLPLPRFAR